MSLCEKMIVIIQLLMPKFSTHRGILGAHCCRAGLWAGFVSGSYLFDQAHRVTAASPHGGLIHGQSCFPAGL